MAGSDSQSVIRAAGLSFRYDGPQVLDGVSLDVGIGEIVGLIGPNGSGKSTVIRLLSGIATGQSGSVHIDGRDTSEMSRREIARLVAVVPQEPEFSFPFTALEVVLMGRHPHLSGLAFESDSDREIAMAALRRCGAEELAGRQIHDLSAGERQRVVFARGLAQAPRALLLDEPASFLDIRYQVEIYDVVRDLAAEGNCGVLTVLHDLNLAAEYCDRLYLMSAGRIEASGTTEEVLTYENLTRVFGTDVYVDTNSITGKLLVIPLAGRVQRRLRQRPERPQGD